MTDNEIIKALESEVKLAEYVDSYYCNGVDLTLIKSAVDIINYQKAEIERLKSELSNTRRKALLEAYSKFEGHSDYHGDTILCKLICMAEGKEVGTATPLDMSEIKVKAYKKFAERLKEGAQMADCFDSYNMVVGTHFIDNLLKEMVGEE